MDFDPWRTAEAAWDVLATRGEAASGWQARQSQRLRALLAHAREHTALHRERLHGLGATPPLATLPVLTRAELMARFDEGVSDPRLTLQAVREFMADRARIGTPMRSRYMVWESSGTGGSPGYFVQDAAALAIYDALEALRRAPRRAVSRSAADTPGDCTPWDPFGVWRAWSSWQPGSLADRYAFVGAIDGHFPSQASVQRLRRLNPWLGVTLHSFSLLQPLPALVEALNGWAPTVLATYPSAAAVLAGEAERGTLRLALAELCTGGETLDAAVRQRVERAFGCAVRDSYGAAECLTIASECAQGQLHLNADWVILEPVDRQMRPVRPGVLSHTTLLTNLANRVQPLIRYDLGDRIRVHVGRCACGSPLPCIDVLGRHDDSVVLGGRDGRPVTLLPLALATVLEEEAGEFEFQLCQRDAHTLALRLGGPPRTSGEVRGRFARCQRALAGFARLQGVEALRVVDEPGVAPTRGRSGKVQRVVALPAAAMQPARAATARAHPHHG